jgi:hypothetical protein
MDDGHLEAISMMLSSCLSELMGQADFMDNNSGF